MNKTQADEAKTYGPVIELPLRELDSGTLASMVTSLRTQLAERDAQLAAYTWNPIKTAPKDGTKIIIRGKNGTAAVKWVFDSEYDENGEIVCVHATEGKWYFLSSYQMYPEEWATHWMLLPEATRQLTQDKEPV